MTTIIGNKYEILHKIGEGTFGKVFKGKNIRSNEDIAIKIQYKDIANVLRHEAKIYQRLKDISGVPIIRNFGLEDGFNYLIIDLLDISLSDTILTPEESIKYMISSINIIELIHNKGIIHRDIKPDNFLIKTSTKTLYIIDFGLSKCYLDTNNKHIIERNDKKLIGTAKFVSLNMHNGIEPSRRDDIISICYSFINLYGKILPWEQIINDYKGYNSTNSNSPEIIEEFYNQIKLKKEEFFLLHDVPGEFLTILLYCKKLKFYETPNYNYIRIMLNNLINIL